MSTQGVSLQQKERAAFQALERAVSVALERLETLRHRAEEAEAGRAEMGELLKRFTQDEGEAPRLLSRMAALEEENRDLRARIEKGREGVERLLARVRFLEEQR